MTDPSQLALSALRKLRNSPGYAGLSPAERGSFAQNLGLIERALRPGSRARDPYALVFATPEDMPSFAPGIPGAPGAGPTDAGGLAEAPAPPPPPPPSATQALGSRAAEALQAVDFTGFVAGLVRGTFQAIVDATAAQVREYADLVASISRSLDDFSRDNVSLAQVRDWFAGRYPGDVQVVLPPAGSGGEARLVPTRQAAGTSPGWLEQFDLAGSELDEELTEGPLLTAGRRKVGEERLQTLATMVLMGINRVVVDNGEVRARLQFHAAAREQTRAEAMMLAAGQQSGLAAQQVARQAAATTMVSTVSANVQSDIGLRADLMGEVQIKFRSETFPLERFADSAAIQLIGRHANWRGDVPGSGKAANGAAPAADNGAQP